VAAAALVAIALAGCGQFDEVASFRVVNDGQMPVVVYQCGNTCGQIHETDRLNPGGSVPFNATVGGPTEYLLVKSGHGDLMGCLSVLIRHVPHSQPVAPASRAVPCSQHLLSRGSWWDRTFG
jgi:hypothetical protein